MPSLAKQFAQLKTSSFSALRKAIADWFGILLFSPTPTGCETAPPIVVSGMLPCW